MIDAFCWIDDLEIGVPSTTKKTLVFFDTIQCALLLAIVDTTADSYFRCYSLINILVEMHTKHDTSQLLNQTLPLWYSVDTIKQIAYYRLCNSENTYTRNTNKQIHQKCLLALQALDAFVTNHVVIPSEAVQQYSMF